MKPVCVLCRGAKKLDMSSRCQVRCRPHAISSSDELGVSPVASVTYKFATVKERGAEGRFRVQSLRLLSGHYFKNVHLGCWRDLCQRGTSSVQGAVDDFIGPGRWGVGLKSVFNSARAATVDPRRPGLTCTRAVCPKTAHLP